MKKLIKFLVPIAIVYGAFAVLAAFRADPITAGVKFRAAVSKG